jgi:AraC-like DNA-binding protein
MAKKTLVGKYDSISLFFLMEESITVSCRETTHTVEKDHFFLIPGNEDYTILSGGQAKLMVFHLEEKLFMSHKREKGLLFDIRNIKLSTTENNELFAIQTNPYIQALLNDCAAVMSNDFICPQYTHCKTEELLILLRSYYPDQILARLFHTVFSIKIDFHEAVMKHKNKFFSVEEYAAAMNMDRNAFRHKFKDIYGLNPVEWILQERVKRVFQDLMEGDKSISEIITEYKFSNFPNFIRFCNMHYKNTPGNIRKIMEGIG